MTSSCSSARPSRRRVVIAFCQRLIEFARQDRRRADLHLRRHGDPDAPRRRIAVFAAATDAESLDELKQLDLEDPRGRPIGGLERHPLGSGRRERGLRGACLLGEMPHIFAQLPYPKASLAVLKAFSTIADIEIDFTELSEQAKEMDQKLGELLEQMEQSDRAATCQTTTRRSHLSRSRKNG